MSALDGSLATKAQALLASPFFTRSFGMIPAEPGVVELDRLVVFQKFIDPQCLFQSLNRNLPSPRSLLLLEIFRRQILGIGLPYGVTVDSSGVATSPRRARYGQVRQILPYAGRRWVFATGRRGVINGRLPAHFV